MCIRDRLIRDFLLMPRMALACLALVCYTLMYLSQINFDLASLIEPDLLYVDILCLAYSYGFRSLLVFIDPGFKDIISECFPMT